MKKIPIDFDNIARQSGKRKGRLFYSPTFKSWAVEDGNDPSIALVDVPEGAIGIKNNNWLVEVAK